MAKKIDLTVIDQQHGTAMAANELQDAFDSLEGNNEQTYFIDLNLVHASDVALANELYERGYRFKCIPIDE